MCIRDSSYTTGDIFTTYYYVNYAKQIESQGADSICIKDMAALLTPYETEGLVRELKKAVSIPIQLHTHYTSGLASMCIMKGVEAGVDVVDTAMSPLALGTSHEMCIRDRSKERPQCRRILRSESRRILCRFAA